MNKIIKHQFFATLLALGVSATMNAQVTIGVNEKPVQGAILQLKNIEGNNEENSTKGLGMPRVQLQSLTGDLAKSLSGSATAGDLDAESHAGLMVYNAPENPNCPAIDSGLYVWSGTEWVPLVQKDLSRIGSVTGKSGISYRTRVFGIAGEWMIDNLRETEYELPETGTLLVDRNLGNSSAMKSYYFPVNEDVDNHTGVLEDDRKFYDTYPHTGLLYTGDGASNGQITDSFNTGAGAVESTVQGVCPAGWRLPSDKDWSDLEKEIATHPELYSKSPAGSTMWSSAPGQGGIPDEDWAVTQGSSTAINEDGRPNGRAGGGRNGHGLSMTLCHAAPTNSFTSKGTSLEDGFCAERTGRVENGIGKAYGFLSNYWTSSQYIDTNNSALIWYRLIQFDRLGVYRAAINGSLLSVRCKKADL